MEHRCSKCGKGHLRFRDAKHLRPASYCAACHAAHMRANRPKHRDLKPAARRRANVRSATNVYQRRGKLKPRACQICGAQVAQKHHEDYGMPLMVTWLCRPCHLKHHRKSNN